MSEHAIAAESGWHVWRTVRLRGAGFAASEILRLADDDLARAADALLDAREARRRAFDEVLLGLRDEPRTPELRKIVRALKKGRRPPGDDARWAPALLADDAHAQATCGLESAQNAAAARNGERLLAALHNPALREAITWQNRAIVESGLNRLAATPADKSDKKTRQRRAKLVSYLQRYHVKNDTIGFFGPVGWATIDSSAKRFDVRPGSDLVRSRRVFFEVWAISALAERFAAREELRLDLAPRRRPDVRLEGTTVHAASGQTAALPAEFAAVLALCDASRSARAIAKMLIVGGEHELEDEDEVFEMLEELEAQGLLTWTLEVPSWMPDPERALRASLSSLPPSAARDTSLADLDRLEAGRTAVAEAAGDATRLASTIDGLEETYAEIAGTDAHRRGGATYGARRIFFEDCVRDVSVTIPPSAVQRLDGPLALLLTSARWYTYQSAIAYRRLCHAIFEEVRAAAEGPVAYADFWNRIGPALGVATEESEINAPIVRTLHAAWAELLDFDATAKRIDRKSSDLADAVAERFAAPRPGWPLARFHSPDVMIAADGPEALAQGAYTFVLGELHVAVNTVLAKIALANHPEPETLWTAHRQDTSGAGVVPVEATRLANRAGANPVGPDDFALEFGTTKAPVPRDRVLAMVDLVMERVDGRLVVRTRDGRHEFDLFEVLDRPLSFHNFSIVPKGRHTPRITLDDVVVCRESWTFAADELPQELTKSDAAFVALRAFQRAHALPRFVFFKVPEEPKPIYLDFDSPALVDLAARVLRRCERVSISEMMPSHDQLWLVDADGRRYTSELRFAMVDPKRWCPEWDTSTP